MAEEEPGQPQPQDYTDMLISGPGPLSMPGGSSPPQEQDVKADPESSANSLHPMDRMRLGSTTTMQSDGGNEGLLDIPDIGGDSNSLTEGIHSHTHMSNGDSSYAVGDPAPNGVHGYEGPQGQLLPDASELPQHHPHLQHLYPAGHPPDLQQEQLEHHQQDLQQHQLQHPQQSDQQQAPQHEQDVHQHQQDAHHHLQHQEAAPQQQQEASSQSLDGSTAEQPPDQLPPHAEGDSSFSVTGAEPINPNPKEKTCSKCKLTKVAGEFFKDKSKPDGLYSQCKGCAASEEKRRRESRASRPPVAVTKKCTRCYIDKDAKEFCQNKRSSDGLYSQCRKCVADKDRDRRQKTLAAKPEVVPEKICSRCGQKKQSVDYYKDASKPDGLQTYCKPCLCAKHKELREKKRHKTGDHQPGTPTQMPEQPLSEPSISHMPMYQHPLVLDAGHPHGAELAPLEQHYLADPQLAAAAQHHAAMHQIQQLQGQLPHAMHALHAHPLGPPMSMVQNHFVHSMAVPHGVPQHLGLRPQALVMPHHMPPDGHDMQHLGMPPYMHPGQQHLPPIAVQPHSQALGPPQQMAHEGHEGHAAAHAQQHGSLDRQQPGHFVGDHMHHMGPEPGAHSILGHMLPRRATGHDAALLAQGQAMTQHSHLDHGLPPHMGMHDRDAHGMLLHLSNGELQGHVGSDDHLTLLPHVSQGSHMTQDGAHASLTQGHGPSPLVRGHEPLHHEGYAGQGQGLTIPPLPLMGSMGESHGSTSAGDMELLGLQTRGSGPQSTAMLHPLGHPIMHMIQPPHSSGRMVGVMDVHPQQLLPVAGLPSMRPHIPMLPLAHSRGESVIPPLPLASTSGMDVHRSEGADHSLPGSQTPTGAEGSMLDGDPHLGVKDESLLADGWAGQLGVAMSNENLQHMTEAYSMTTLADPHGLPPP